MKHLSRTLILAIAAVTLVPAAASLAAEDEKLTAKGIYHDVDRYQRSGLKFNIVMDEHGKGRRVPTTFPFRTGDRFTFRFEINRDTHVYVINRTQVSPGASLTAGYEPKRVRGASIGEPRLLFPTSQAGNNNRLASNKEHAVPRRGYLVMDDQTGVEKLYVVISDRRLDFSDYFRPGTGELRSSTNPRATKLQAKLDQWKDNALVELVSKGIRHEVDSYSAVVDAKRPAVVEIDLNHYR